MASSPFYLTTSALFTLLTIIVLLYGGKVHCRHTELEGCEERDEFYSVRHVCQPSCLYTASCTSPAQCVCDGRCGQSCIDVDNAPSCLLSLVAPVNGLLWLSSQSVSELGSFDTVLHYVCHDDHLLIGQADSICMSNGQWSSDPPYCIYANSEPNCPPPEPPQNARVVVLEDSRFDSNNVSLVRFECLDGFKAVGRQQNTSCIPGVGWQSADMECIRMKCDSPGIPVNGFLTSLDFRYGSTISYQCQPSYALNDSPRSTCLTNGTWESNPPTCGALHCPVPDFAAGTFTTSDLNYLIGTRVTFECLQGDDLVGESSTVCQENLSWSSPPPDCQEATCSRPYVQTRGISITSPVSKTVFAYGESVGYRCLSFKQVLHGDKMRQCAEGGRWTAEEPSCHEICRPLPATIPGGDSLNLPSNDRYNWHMGEKIYFCNGFAQMFGNNRFVCRDGIWNPINQALPRCQTGGNNDAHAFGLRSMTHGIINGVLRVKQREPSVVIDCRIPTGYENPRWVRDQQTPSGVQFSLEPESEDVQWHRLQLENIAQPDAGVYRCISDENYSSSVHLQVIVTCADPGYQEGRRTNRNTEGGVPAGRGGFVGFECDPGYMMVGEYSQIGCDITGNWSHDPPNCVKPSCTGTFFPKPDNGFTDTTLLSNSSALQAFQCAIGYRMLHDGVEVPDLLLSCNDGVWNENAAPVCSPREDMITITSNGIMKRRNIMALTGDWLELNCSQNGNNPHPRWIRITHNDTLDLEVVQNENGVAALIIPSVSVENAGEYECSSADRSYRETVNLVVNARCAYPHIQYGFVVPSAVKSQYYETDVVIFDCNPEFILCGDRQLTCSVDGWDAEFPKCVQDVDLALYMYGSPLPDGSTIWRTEGVESIYFDCMGNASTEGMAELSRDGVIGWSKTAPNGQRLEMSADQRLVTNGQIGFLRLVLTDLTYDFAGQYVCGTLFETVSVNLRVTVPCKTLPPIAHGTLELADNRSVAWYRCDELYQIISDNELHCLTNGKWNGTLPICVVAYCPALILQPGVITSPKNADKKPVPLGTTVGFSCIQNMTQSGPFDITCQPDGLWSEQLESPSCTDLCRDFPCPLGKQCSVVDNVPACTSCMDESDCPTLGTNGNNGPLCGTDASDYPSECALAIQACHDDNPALIKAFDGPCAYGSLCFLRPTIVSRSSCPHTNLQFYFNTNPNVLQCVAVTGDECLVQGGFETKAECEGNCSRNFCNDPSAETGPCYQYEDLWTYNSITRLCQTFVYGGCPGTRGNQNRFKTQNECIRMCHHQEVCPPCPETMTLSNACFYGKHALIISIIDVSRFANRDYMRFTVDVLAVLTQDRSGSINFSPGPGQRIYCPSINLNIPCATCPRLPPLVDQQYLFVSSTYRGDNLKLDDHSFVAEWTPNLEARIQATPACAEWVERLNILPLLTQ